MKIVMNSLEEMTLFLTKQEIKNCNFEDIDEVEEYFRSLFLKLKEYYHIDIEGFYQIDVFLDKDRGMVLELEKEDLEYYRSFHQLEMRIRKEDTTFLYEVEDILDFPLKKIDIYVYNKHFYVKEKNQEVYSLYEHGKLIYENTNTIMKNGICLTR